MLLQTEKPYNGFSYTGTPDGYETEKPTGCVGEVSDYHKIHGCSSSMCMSSTAIYSGGFTDIRDYPMANAYKYVKRCWYTFLSRCITAIHMRNLALMKTTGPKRLPFIKINNIFTDFTQKRIIVGTLASTI